jgi:N6-L-threonylcarbamoyladenine synthase
MKSNKSLVILGIETSCDETAASIIEARADNIKVLSNIVSSQAKIHARWGGVVPNLAAREHLENIIPVLEIAFKKSGIKPRYTDLISVTRGPGLIPALLIGTNVAKTLSYVWQKPLLGIHHIEGHIYANFVGESSKFPILCLVVSGGHTQLILMKKHLDYKIIGETLDDAAGEAFDKVARILGLGYPGGPAIADTAMKLKVKSAKFKVTLPRPMINSNNLNMSFSGLKTAVLYETKRHSHILKNMGMKSVLCAEFQQAVIDVLITKTIKAAKIYHPKTIMLAGGVSANIELRNQLRSNLRRCFPHIYYKIPDTKYSIDNAVMIATAGFHRWKNMTAMQRKKSLQNWKSLQPDANLKLK